MNEKTKYLAVIILAIAVSAATSYVTTLSLHSLNAQGSQQQSSQQAGSEQAPHKVSLAYDVDFFAPGSTVIVSSSVALQNLTIVYQYTYPNGTTVTSNVDYGDYYPWWGTGTVIRVGAVPSAIYAIPDYIQALATTYVDPDNGITKISNPNCKVLEVYGYS